MKWFKHDSNAHTDAKLQKVLMRYGADGYATYWYSLELIAGKVDAKNITFELEHDAELIGHVLKIDQLCVEEIMLYMTELGLFDNSEGVITCLKMATRLDDTNSRNPHIKQIVSKIYGQKALGGIPSENPEDSPTKSGQNRTDKNRTDENNKNKKKVGFQPPSVSEVQKHLDAKGISGFTGEDFVDYYESIGWVVGKNKPVKNWQRCVTTWKRNNPRKGTSEEMID